jgi:putative hemolysin
LPTLALFLSVLIVFLVLSAFFSGAETALMSVNRLRIKYLADSGDKKAQRIQQILANPDRLLGVILLGNTVANIGSASLATYLVTEYTPQNRAEQVSILVSVILTLIILIGCELTPKIVAAAHSEEISKKIIWPIRTALVILDPVSRVSASVANCLVRLLGFAPTASPFVHALSEDEIRAIIAGSNPEAMGTGKREMLSNVMEIAGTQIREIMIPRVEVTAVDIDDPVSEIISVITKTKYSRLPVYRGNFDNVLGILNVKDLLPMERLESIKLQSLLRPVQFVPDTARLDAVLRQFQSMHLHIAVVVDEFGGVEGIVTLEDLLEEIVGEIRDEHDTETEAVHELGPGLYSVAGNFPVKDFNRVFEIKIPESPEYATVVGFLQARTGRLLQKGETVRYQNASFSVEQAEGFRIISLRVRVPPKIHHRDAENAEKINCSLPL